MEYKTKEEFLDTIRTFRLPRYEEIPDVGLYLEQVTKYISGYLEPFSQINITSSMISNYVKKHLIAGPQKKLYGREHIAYLVFIAVTKSVLSLDQIATLISLQQGGYENETAYDYFCEQFEKVLAYVFGFSGELEKLGDELSGEKTMMRNTIITVAHRIYLDFCFDIVYKQ